MNIKHIRKPALAASAALILGLTMSACSTETTSSGSETDAGQPAATSPETVETPGPEAPAAPSVGVPFTADMGNGNTARITVVSAEYADTASTQSFAPAAQNGGFLVLDVLWETEAGVTSSNPLYFNTKDAEGRAGDYYMFADNQLGSGEVQVGDKSRGTVVFDIAPGPATVVITDPLLQETARIQVGG
ncbi:DUF4352 domain-containing protein [Arthrobacter caoxuetaonis]|uniref:DUF4352 domain-containing protein n=1 Tax=Arthrobacter caoxuetaonis TaxID=2886935 RepID=A0A9X1MDN7_9MICC|nr:DUF4352 domain-containing protein [Arthrobacter caoxuetaonis]MCC3296824.1 DUF4352 domain-containing protein [Arthrobacter caoxuetaonis]USQ56358.1 DUF4352 domain-containing protein [Arthrobacter caoxuetaonis]